MQRSLLSIVLAAVACGSVGCSGDASDDDSASAGTGSGAVAGSGASGGSASGGSATGGGGSTGGKASGGAGANGATGGSATGGTATGGSGGAGGSGGSGTGGSGGSGAGVGGRGSGGDSAGGSNAGGSGAGDAGMGNVGNGDPAVRFVGRMDTTDAAGPRFAWSGSGMIARFSGTTVGVKLGGGQEYTVLIDGELEDKLVPSSGVSPIAEGLTAGEHTVELYRRTEAGQGVSQFLGFDFGQGMLLGPPAAPNRRLEVIGDSITCGYGNEGADMNCGFTPETENHYATYAALSARDVGADLVTVAWSGKGMVCNYGDDASSCVDPLPDRYDLTLPDQPASVWDFSYQPHAVIINLGTNDFSTNDDPTQMEFEDAYAAFLEHLRSKYADAWILCTIGPMLSGSDLDAARTDIAGAVTQRTQAGDAKVKTFELTPQDGADGYGCDWHPSLATHEKMATVLTAELKSTLGW
jgi:hypothetical protein